MCLHFLFTLTQWYKKWPQWAPNSSISGGYLERLEGEKNLPTKNDELQHPIT
jgi:hypothetical protein